MKKYLMTGVAALAIFAAFTSCSKNEELYDPGQIKQNEIAQVYNSYNQAFIQTFGQPAANQDWGFKSITAGTRAGAEPTANIWADQGYKAPRELTAGQKTRVMAYFQANPYLTYVDPEYTNFFVQQVYKGYTSPGAISAEKYKPTDTNNEDIIGSNHMDHLTFGITSEGTAKDHNYNFNCGRFSSENASDPNGTPRENVQNWPGVTYLTTYTGTDGKQYHKDHIMLMLGSSTESVGFQDSNGSLVHLDCCANAGAAVIDAWALAHKDSLEAIGKFGETVTDEWQRSFVGLDYEQQTINELYAGKTAKALDFIDGNSQYILYKGVVYSRNGFADFDLKDPGNNAVQYIKNTVSNMGIAEYIKYTKTDGNVGKVTKDAYNYKLTQAQYKSLYNYDISNGEAGLYNLDMILGYIYESALPTESDGNWVKNIGGRDYVFSDWIVTLTKADPIDIPNEKVIRIMAEDLNAKAVDGDIEDSDWDFNDVVLDVKFLGNDKVRITVVAAGGTLPLRINGEDGLEVHELYKQATNIMINTCRTEALQKKYPNHYNTTTLPSFERTITGVDADGGRSIKLEVQKTLSDGSTAWFVMDATYGEPAAKFACKQTVDFCNEREHIASKYNNFGRWVQHADLVWYDPITPATN